MPQPDTIEICPHCMGSGEGAASQPCWTCNGTGGVPQTTTKFPAQTEAVMQAHVEQRIQERLNLGHLYCVEDGEDGPEASCTGPAAASVWRVVLDAVREAGWRVTK